MSNRTAIIAAALIAGCVLIVSFASISVSAARAADECLTAPKAITPEGGHWYYRLEKGTKRKCWYLGDAGAKVSKPTTTAAAATSPDETEQDAAEPAAVPAPAPTKPMRKSVANARAELPAPAPDDDPALAGSTWPPLNELSSNTPANIDTQSATAAPQPAVTEPAPTPNWMMASRWPEPNAVASANDQPVQAPQDNSAQAPALTPERLATAVTTAAATTPVTPTAEAAPKAPQPQAESETISIGLLLSVLVCVLALAAIIGPLIFNYVKPRNRKTISAAGQRRPIWDTDKSRPSAPLFALDERRRQPMILDDDLYVDETPYAADSAADEIEELLARASRRPAA